MGDTGWIAFGSALAGAVVGGGATGAATYYVTRGERRHNAMATLYLSLLPELRTTRPQTPHRAVTPGRPEKEVLEDVVRTATVAGGQALRLAKEVFTAHAYLTRPQRPNDPVLTSPGGSTFPDRRGEEAKYAASIGAFDMWLARKLEGGAQAFRP